VPVQRQGTDGATRADRSHQQRHGDHPGAAGPPGLEFGLRFGFSRNGGPVVVVYTPVGAGRIAWLGAAAPGAGRIPGEREPQIR